MPTSREHIKWSKLGPNLDWIILAYLPHRLLPKALERLGFDKDRRGDEQHGQAEGADVDAKLKEDLDFAAIRGTRFKASC